MQLQPTFFSSGVFKMSAPLAVSGITSVTARFLGLALPSVNVTVLPGCINGPASSFLCPASFVAGAPLLCAVRS